MSLSKATFLLLLDDGCPYQAEPRTLIEILNSLVEFEHARQIAGFGNGYEVWS